MLAVYAGGFVGDGGCLDGVLTGVSAIRYQDYLVIVPGVSRELVAVFGLSKSVCSCVALFQGLVRMCGCWSGGPPDQLVEMN